VSIQPAVTINESERSKILREVNDTVRSEIFIEEKNKTVPCKVLHTKGIVDRFSDDMVGLIKAVQNYEDFREANDPNGEHDMGFFKFGGQDDLIWKIDYYDQNLEYGSNDPCCRCLQR